MKKPSLALAGIATAGGTERKELTVEQQPFSGRNYTALLPNKPNLWENQRLQSELAQLIAIARNDGEDKALDVLLLEAKLNGGWTPELDYLGLRLLKPDVAPGLEIHG